MRWSFLYVSILLACSLAAPAGAQSASASEAAPSERGVPITELIESYARHSGKKVLVDPRVRGATVLLFAPDPARIDYEELLQILNVHGYAAAEEGGYVRVIPDANIRQQALPLVTGSENLPAAQWVTAIIRVKSVNAVHLVPLLRPLLPQSGHLAALPCKNTLIMVDTLASVRRIKSIIESLDIGQPLVPHGCEEPETFGPPGGPPPPPRDGPRERLPEPR